MESKMVSKLIGIATIASLSAIAVAALAAFRPGASPPPRVADKAPHAAKADPQSNGAGRRGKPGDPEHGEGALDHDDD